MGMNRPEFEQPQFNASCLGVVPGSVARVAMVGPGYLYRLASGILHRSSHSCLACALLLLVGRRYRQVDRMPEGVYCTVDFAALAPLAAVTACARKIQVPENGLSSMFLYVSAKEGARGGHHCRSPTCALAALVGGPGTAERLLFVCVFAVPI